MPPTYHAAQVDSLADTSTLNQLLNEAGGGNEFLQRHGFY